MIQDTFEFLARGGPIMGVIAFASVSALAIFIERLWSLQRHRIVPARFVHVVRDLLTRGRLDEARNVCSTNDSSIAVILHAGLRHAGGGRALIREAMQDRGRREAAELERFTGALGSIATVSPLLGLLGTITGMIKTFQRVNETVAQTGDVSPGALASGIWEALVTTAAGLAVAIPAFLAYRFIIAKVDRLVIDLEEVSLDMVDLMVDTPAGGGGTRTAADDDADDAVESDA